MPASPAEGMEGTGYLLGRAFVPLAIGLLAARLVWRTSPRRPAGAPRMRRRIAAALAGLAAAFAVLLLSAAGRAQEPSFDPQAELDGFARGLSESCLERCEDGDADCTAACACLAADLPDRLDPETLNPRGRTEPAQEDIAAFVEANREAILGSVERCGVALE